LEKEGGKMFVMLKGPKEMGQEEKCESCGFFASPQEVGASGAYDNESSLFRCAKCTAEKGKVSSTKAMLWWRTEGGITCTYNK
jgi:hypothetical protein